MHLKCDPVSPYENDISFNLKNPDLSDLKADCVLNELYERFVYCLFCCIKNSDTGKRDAQRINFKKMVLQAPRPHLRSADRFRPRMSLGLLFCAESTNIKVNIFNVIHGNTLANKRLIKTKKTSNIVGGQPISFM